MYRYFSIFAVLATPALADAPRVVADIAPVHGLVAMVMDGVGAPELLLRPDQSPHTYSMRPSDARKLQKADAVFWVGHGLTPWLEDPLSALSSDAVAVELLEVEGLPLLAYEEDHDDDHDEDHDEDHDDHDDDHAADHDKDHDDHDDHGDHGADHKDGHDEDHSEGHEDGHKGHEDGHKEGHEDGHDDGHDDGHEEADGHHHHGEFDPHAWLDPEIAVLWLDAIADALSAADPDNGETYHKNAAAAQAEITAVQGEIAAQLTPVQDIPFVAFHDAYRYFEHRYGLHNAGTVSSGDASAPGAAHMVELQAEIVARGVKCAFAEPQFDPKLLAVAGEKAEDLRLVNLDPMGAHIEPGPAFYPALLRDLAGAISGCLSAG